MNKDKMMPTFHREKKSGIERRNETRYGCIGVPAMFSPEINDAVSDFGSLLFNAALQDMSFSGMGFNIDTTIEKGEKVIIILDSPNEVDKELLVTTVSWSKKLENNSYRVGVKIDTSVPVQKDKNVKYVALQVAGPDIPQEVNINCPACNQPSSFGFIALQPLMIDKGVMPLYSCSQCGTTRTLMGIFMQAKKSID